MILNIDFPTPVGTTLKINPDNLVGLGTMDFFFSSVRPNKQAGEPGHLTWLNSSLGLNLSEDFWTNPWSRLSQSEPMDFCHLLTAEGHIV